MQGCATHTQSGCLLECPGENSEGWPQPGLPRQWACAHGPRVPCPLEVGTGGWADTRGAFFLPREKVFWNVGPRLSSAELFGSRGEGTLGDSEMDCLPPHPPQWTAVLHEAALHPLAPHRHPWWPPSGLRQGGPPRPPGQQWQREQTPRRRVLPSEVWMWPVSLAALQASLGLPCAAELPCRKAWGCRIPPKRVTNCFVPPGMRGFLGCGTFHTKGRTCGHHPPMGLFPPQGQSQDLGVRGAGPRQNQLWKALEGKTCHPPTDGAGDCSLWVGSRRVPWDLAVGSSPVSLSFPTITITAVVS